MKTIVLNRKFYVKPSMRVPEEFDVWKNNGTEGPDEIVAGPFASPGDADAFARQLEAKERASERDNRSMKTAAEILLGYLADNPEITKCLLDKAVKHAAEKQRAAEQRAKREAAKRKLAELCAQGDALTREIESIQAEINRLKGRTLSLQKARKAVVQEAITLSNALGVQP
jgi:hypothetical protein